MHRDDQDATSTPTPAGTGGTDGEAADASTGDAGVDEALGRLTELERLPVRDHVGVFDAVHAALQDRLADVED